MATIALGFFAIAPWHIMKSRWGMECNLFPDLILLGVFLFILGIKKKNDFLQILAFVVFAISSYSYGTAYLFLPVFVLLSLGYLVYKKEITIKKSILFLSIMFLICIPIILYIYINTFKLSQINIGKVTIPRLATNRYEETTTIFSGNILSNCANNLQSLIRLLILQNDKLDWNALPGYGMFYLISLIFLCIGIVESITKYKNNVFNSIMNIWMVSSIVLGAFCIINVNRINIIMIPCIYYISIGLYDIFEKYKKMIPCIITIYICMFLSFIHTYWTADNNEYFTFTSGIKEVAEYCESQKVQNIYCDYSFKEPFIYFMFYTKANVNEYIQTVEYFKKDRNFDNIKSYGKYNFYLPKEIDEDCIIIVPEGKTLELEAEEKININQFVIYKVRNEQW